MKIAFVRGAYLNNFEGQNYQMQDNKFQITGYSSLWPIDFFVPFPVIKLPSISDVQKISFLNKPIKYIANRTLGDAQVLFGLENHTHSSDIMHIADPHYYYSYQGAKLRAVGKVKKLLSTWWETIPYNNESTSAKKRIKKFSMSKIDAFLCHSNKAKKCLLLEGVTDQKITFVPLGVDLEKFKPRLVRNLNIFTILFVGRLVEEKGIMDLYTSFKEVVQEVRNMRLNIVGTGPLETTLNKLIQKDGLKNKVTIYKKKYYEMPAVFQQADVLCVPSKKTKTWEEQYGMVFIEAMASGLPIVSYATGAIAELVQDVGMVFEEGNINKLVQSFKRLYSDRQILAKLGTMGRYRAEKVFDARKIGKRIGQFYESLNSNN